MRPIFFFKSFNSKSIIELIETIDDTNNNEEFVLYIKSDGGYVDDCLLLLEYLENSNIKFHVVGVGVVASTAAHFMLKCKALSKKCLSYAHVVLHLPDTDISLKSELGIQKPGKHNRALYNLMVDDYIKYYKKVGIPASNLKNFIDGEDVFLTPQDFQKMLDRSMKDNDKNN